MVAKKGKAKQTTGERMFDDVREQMEDTFLAGLGVFSNAQEAGAKTFDKLVKQGEKFRKEATKETESMIDDVRDAIRKMTDDAQSTASDWLDMVRDRKRFEKLEAAFDKRVGKFEDAFDKRVVDALKRLNIPAKSDLDAIDRKLMKIEKLMEERLPMPEKKVAVAAERKPATTPVKKTAVKKPSAKKPAPKQAA